MSFEGTSGLDAPTEQHPTWDPADQEASVEDFVDRAPESGPRAVDEPIDSEQVASDALATDEAGLPFADEPVTLVDSDVLPALGEAARARGYLWIPLPTPGPAHRGRLGLYIEETIEDALEERGALSPGIVASTGLDASVSDQLYRARLIEMRGIALGIPSLEGITNLGRTLDADDSSVLRWWMAASSDRPVRLIISRENLRLRAYQAPVFFEALFETAAVPLSPRAPAVGMAESAESMDLSDLPPRVAPQPETNVYGTELRELDDPSAQTGGVSRPSVASTEDAVTDVEEDYLLADRSISLLDLDRALGLPGGEPEPQPAVSIPQTVDAAAPAEEAALQEVEPVNAQGHTHSDEIDAEEFLRTLAEDSARAPAVEPDLDAVLAREAVQEALPDPEPHAPVVSVAAAPAPADPSPGEELPTKVIERKPFIRFATAGEAVHGAAPSLNARSAQPEIRTEQEPASHELEAADRSEEPPRALSTQARATLDPDDPFNQLATRKWQSWVSNLVAARGPKPLSVIERMFVTDYTRLREAVRRGVADPSANQVLDEWRDAFTNSYGEAYEALRVRGKRPTMVLDLPELSKRLGRLQGAKRVQLLLVDGMRFDLGLMVQERLRKCAAASLTERLLLWSALPSVTSHQLELLGRGPDGLKDPPTLDESPALVARGRAALTPRRVRTGSLEILKLDVVEDMLRQPGIPVLDRLDAIADATADAIAAHIEKLPERTMVVVFGDHGFALDPAAVGTTEEVKQGGSTPEEVLVPAFAWLTGATH